MNKSKHKYQKYDWEGIIYPIALSQIQSITNHYDIPINAQLTIWRDEEYKLKGRLEGVIDDVNDLEYKENGQIKKVGFIKGETLEAKSKSNNFMIEGFGIESTNFHPVERNKIKSFGFSCDVYLESISINGSNNKPEIITEWYLCSMPSVLFSNRTSRYESHPRYKVRHGVDAPIENEQEFIKKGYSGSWDFSIVKYNNYEIIIQSVPKIYLPKEIDGIAIEYRNYDSNLTTSEFRKMFHEYVSFILGTHLQNIGTSKFIQGYELLSYKSQNPWKKRFKKNGNINPIPLKNGADRFFFENQLNRLLSNFVNLYEKSSLSDCLWKLWIGAELSIGVNLPIIASGFEALVNSYLENNNLIKKYTRSEKRDYRSLIEEELDSLKTKLTLYDFAPFVLNKLENPYNYGIGEKFKIFFDNISIEFDNDSLENKALKARNLMTHSGVNFDSEVKIREIKKISDAYVTLVNRVILRLLNYKWYYVDYSKEGVKYLKMDENM